jgi:tetratricopeptide (TPR) repeat protein
MDNSDKMIEAYISKLFEVQRARENQPLTEQELKEIALDAGMSEEDWQAAQEVADDHNARAEGFLGYKNWTEAINEYEQTLRIRPQHPQPLSGIAYALKMRWQTTQNSQDKERALAYARQCLQVSPENAQSLMIVSELSQQNTPTTKSKSGFNAKQVPLVIGVGVLAVVALLWFNLQPDQVAPKTQPSIQADTKEVTSSNTAPLPKGLVFQEPVEQNVGVKELSNEFKTLFGNRTSHHSQYRFTNTGQNPIAGLKATVTWYDKNQREIISNHFYVLKEGDATIAPKASKTFTIKQSFPQGIGKGAYQYHTMTVKVR